MAAIQGAGQDAVLHLGTWHAHVACFLMQAVLAEAERVRVRRFVLFFRVRLRSIALVQQKRHGAWQCVPLRT